MLRAIILCILCCCCCFCCCLETSATTLLMKYCDFHKPIFNRTCLLDERQRLPIEVEDCKLTLNDNGFRFICSANRNIFNHYFFDDIFTMLQGTCAMDSNYLNMFNCLAKNQTQQICDQTEDYYQQQILRNCSSKNIETIEMFTYNHTNQTFFNSLTTLLSNLRNLTWHVYGKCSQVSGFTQSFKYIESLDLHINQFDNFEDCEDILFNNQNQLRQLNIYLHSYSKGSIREYVYGFPGKFLQGLSNLNAFEVHCIKEEYLQYPIFLPIEIFEGLHNLSSLVFVDCNIVQLKSEHFEDLINLRSIEFRKSDTGSLEWLSSATLQNHLKYLKLSNIIPSNRTYVSMHHLEKYLQLGIVDINLKQNLFTPQNGYNISAYLCGNSELTCNLNMDKNKHQCPDSCTCYLDRRDMRFVINCKDVQIPEIPIPVIGNVSLYLEQQDLINLPNSTLYGYSNIKELHLTNNRISNLTLQELPRDLTFLDISNNNLKSLDTDMIEYLSNQSIRLKLSGNPWSCDCENYHVISFVQSYSDFIEDRNDIKCFQPDLGAMKYLTMNIICKSFLRDNIYTLITIAICILIILIIILSILYKNSILMFLYEHNICLSLTSRKEPESDNDMKIDAFVSFSHLDLHYVEEFVEKLERGPYGYHLCFYHRDWLIGESITQCILKSIEDSRRIIILMTKSFVRSSWGLFEFRNSINAASLDNNKRLIIILYPDVDVDQLDADLRLYLKLNTYLDREDPLFWRKLFYAMPHKERQVAKSKPINIDVYQDLLEI